MTSATVPTFSSMFADLKTEAVAEWEKLKGEAAADVAYIAASLGPVIKSEAAVVLSQFKTVAIQTVIMLARQEYATLTGAQKNGITANTILQSAYASGKSVALQDAATFAQDAFDAFNETKPQ